jgi:prepilin peptidase CpaA
MTALTAVLLLPFTMAIGIWVSWSDMKFMKIPNNAVLALAAVWLIFGLILVPWQVWIWGVGLGAGVLVAGFVGATLGLFGAGDAKFSAAMAPFFVLGDARNIMVLLAASLLGAFAAHRLARALPAFRARSSDWESWTHSDFPMGLALAGALNIYLILRAASLI